MKRQKVRKLLQLVSLLLFPVTLYYFSPYLILEGGFAGIVSGSLLTFAALFAFSLLFGRAFCGWLCPAGALQEVCAQAVDKKVSGKWVNRIKYLLWAPWLLGIVLAFVSAGGIRSADFFYRTDHGISASGTGGWFMYFSVVGLILVPALLLGRRGMCHSVCWMAPFMVIGTKIKNILGYPSLRLRAEPEKCTGCGLCSRNCPMSLDISEMVRRGRAGHGECILCGECADRCRSNAVRLTFGGQK